MVSQHRARQQVALRPGDERAADPVHPALDATAVGDHHVHAVNRGVGLNLGHLGGPLPHRARGGGPVDRGRDQVGAVQGGQPGPLRELQVVADHHGHLPVRQRDHRRGVGARGEDQLLPVPQVGLAVDSPGAGLVNQSGAVVEQAVVTQLTEPAHHRAAVGGGQVPPLVQRGAVRGPGGQAPGLVRAGEHITGVGQLGQHDQARALGRGIPHGPGRGGAVGVRVAQDRAELGGGDQRHEVAPA